MVCYLCSFWFLFYLMKTQRYWVYCHIRQGKTFFTNNKLLCMSHLLRFSTSEIWDSAVVGSLLLYLGFPSADMTKNRH